MLFLKGPALYIFPPVPRNLKTVAGKPEFPLTSLSLQEQVMSQVILVLNILHVTECRKGKYYLNTFAGSYVFQFISYSAVQ